MHGDWVQDCGRNAAEKRDETPPPLVALAKLALQGPYHIVTPPADQRVQPFVLFAGRNAGIGPYPPV
jgi:hypothetical protein